MDSKEFDPDGVGVDNGAYFGFPFTPEESALVLISAPWDVTVSYGAGTALAPDALIEASTQLDFYDPAAPEQWRRGIATADVDYTLLESSQHLRSEAEKIIDHLEAGGAVSEEYVQRRLTHVNQGCAAMNDNIQAQATEWLTAGKIVGLVGGDHSTPYGLIKALSTHHAAFGILHIDAHCDLRQAYEGFEFSHASIMYNVLRDLPQVCTITQVAVRDFSQSEAQLAADSKRVRTFSDRDLAQAEYNGRSWDAVCCEIVASLPQQVYISFDIDGLSIENCPHTGTPVPGGLSFNRAAYLLESLVQTGRQIIGFDLVEVSPHPEERIDAVVGARMLYKLTQLTLKSNK